MPFDPNIYASNWTMVAFSAIVAVVAIGGMFMASRVLSSRRPSETKLSTYECGIEPAPVQLVQHQSTLLYFRHIVPDF